LIWITKKKKIILKNCGEVYSSTSFQKNKLFENVLEWMNESFIKYLTFINKKCTLK